MWKRITISLIFFFVHRHSFSQTSFSDSLLNLEKRIYTCLNDTVKQALILNKITFCLANELPNTAILNEVKRVNYSLLPATPHKQIFFWNACLVAYFNDDINYAQFYFSEYEKLNKDTTVTANLLAVLLYKNSDTLEVNKRLLLLSKTDSVFNQLTCFNACIRYERKHINRYLIASAIIPGLGTMLNGAVVKGLISLALASTSLYGIIKLVEYGLYINAALWGTGVGLKFYTGNIKLTQKQFQLKEAQQKNKLATSCELILNQILVKYPIVTLRY